VGTVYERVMKRGAKLIVKTVESITSGIVDLKPQNPSKESKHAPKIFREDCEIDWNQESEKIRNFIRGLSPYPAAWTTLHNLTFKIYHAEVSDQSYSDKPGSFKTDNKTYLDVITSNGALTLKEVQLQGKKKMPIGDFLRGYKV